MPLNSASRYQRFSTPSWIRAARSSSLCAEAGSTRLRFRTMPTPAAPPRTLPRTTGVATPCESSRLWATRGYRARSARPGAWTPVADDVRVVREAVDCLAVGPATTVLQGLGQVPVVERDERPDAALEQELDQAIVEVEPRSVGPPASFRLHARPGHREAVGAQTQLAHQGHVVAGAMIVIVSGLARAAVGNRAGDGGEAVPNAL